jgi:Holliday junction resolvase RusA-like endonuclease
VTNSTTVWLEEVRILVPGPVVPERKRQVPARGSFHGARVDTPDAAGYKQRVFARAVEAMNGRALLEGPLQLDLRIVRLRPKSAKRSVTHPTTRPDCTNCTKLVEDALNGVVWVDDAQIVCQRIEKVFGDAPGLDVRVSRICAHEEAGDSCAMAPQGR